MKKYLNKYRAETFRAPFWDYGWNGGYFVTLITKNRRHWFGHVVDGKMDFTAMGHIANSCWYEIPNHFPFVELGAHIIMPNHVHGIISIKKTQEEQQKERESQMLNHETIQLSPNDIPDVNQQSMPNKPKPKTKNKFGPQSNNLASIIRGYKVGVTKNARQLSKDFSWQPLYHDIIIRDSRAYHNITNYIKNNPKKWHEDKFYTK
jgi:REP element-mobilizing transposase RayT